MFGVYLTPFGLAIGAVRAADIRTFVIIHAQPMQTVDQLLLSTGAIAFLIGILNP